MNNKFHFYASSVATWSQTTPKRGLRDLIKTMDADGLTWSLYFVPVGYDEDYEIRGYKPDVPGVVLVETFKFMEGKPA